MLEQLAVANNPAPLIRLYHQASGVTSFPPTFDDLVKSIVPVERQTTTSPNHVVRFKQLLVLATDDGRQVVMPRVSVTDKALDSLAVLSVRDNLDAIKDDLGLSVTQLAELFDVTRKSVYDWFDGAEPRQNTLVRIDALVEALSAVPAEIDKKRLKGVWKVPVADRSFFAVLNDEKLDASNLGQALSDKLHQLYPRLLSSAASSVRASAALGNAHLAEFDRQGDFS